MKCITMILVFIFCSYANAQNSYQSKDWSTGWKDDGSPYISTINASGEVLMKVCAMSDQTCYWILGVKTKCESGAAYPAPFNTSIGSSVHNVHCTTPTIISGAAYYRYAIAEPDGIDNIVKTASGVVGIATPLQSGLFQIYRFSLDGSGGLVELLSKMVVNGQVPKTKSNSRDTKSLTM